MTAEDTLRAAVVSAAAAEIGPGDTPKYWASVGYKPPFPKPGTKHGHWCGAFALWALHEAGLARDVMWRVGLGFAEVERLSRVTIPKPGDVGYDDEPFQHHFLVESVDGSEVTTIEGNTPGVIRRKRSLSDKGITYYSIGKFIRAALAAAPERTPVPSEPPTLQPFATVRFGDRGVAVSEAQLRLRKLGLDVGTVDGAFGPRTRGAVQKFQALKGLQPDGVVGPLTWRALEAATLPNGMPAVLPEDS